MEGDQHVADVDAEQMHLAEQLAMPEKSWPAVSSKPGPFKDSGKFAVGIELVVCGNAEGVAERIEKHIFCRVLIFVHGFDVF